MFLERIEESVRLARAKAIGESAAFAPALGEIARDRSARDAYLRFAEDADLPRTRARMIELAVTLGWLSPADSAPSSCGWSAT